MTAAEKMRAYRQRKKEAGFIQRNIWVPIRESATVVTVIPSGNTNNRRAQWKKELKQEQLAAARKEGRRLARMQDSTFQRGRVIGICEAADFFVGKARVDIVPRILIACLKNPNLHSK